MSHEQDSQLTFGWIGVGRMGFELAARLLDAGYDVAVYNRTQAKAEPLREKGATVVARPIDLADRDVVFTMVSGPEDFKAVTIGEGGVLTGERAPSILIDSSTVSAEASATVREQASARGAALLAAPVSGNPKVVRAGQATLAVSGPAEAFETVRPALETLGRGVSYVGEGDRARLVKIAHNVFLGIVAQSLAEITVLAELGGIDRRSFLDFANDSVMGSVFTRYKTPGLVTLDWTPTFTPALLRKDLDLGLEAAEAVGTTLPLATATRARVQSMIDAGLTDVDFQALLVLQAQEAGLELEPQPGPVPDGLEPEPEPDAVTA